MGNWLGKKPISIWFFNKNSWYAEKPIDSFFSKELKTRDCIICWKKVKDLFIYVKCDLCKKVLHNTCAYTYIETHLDSIVCPHCNKAGLYYYNYDTFRKI
jgi:hypothetical protein